MGNTSTAGTKNYRGDSHQTQTSSLGAVLAWPRLLGPGVCAKLVRWNLGTMVQTTDGLVDSVSVVSVGANGARYLLGGH